ncbi:MAG: diguanylate cyclase [Thermodesulfobacteriota bacterium]
MKHYKETHSPANSKPLARSNSVSVKRYVGIISLVITSLVIAIFWGFNSRQTNLLKQQMAHQARAFFQEIVQTRRWIIDQEGVYVKEKPGTHIDPVLAEIEGLKTSIKDKDGQTYLLRNHAAITKMISAIATEERLFGINITSLNPLAPHNEPDPFERSALLAFDDGANEIYRFVKTTGGVLFRYMAPLLTKKSCLKCHAQQGYEIGDIRGGISISIPAKQITIEINKTRVYSLISAIALLTLLLSLIICIAKRFTSDLDKSEKRLVELATTDPLTGLLNRREGVRRFQEEISHSMREKLPLAMLLLDIDLLKQINDNFGHQTGDEAIKMVADTLRDTLRDYDIICRYGGEEYLIVLPTTDLAKALETAERIRLLLEQKVIQTRTEKKINLTASCGVSTLQSTDTLDSLIYRADNALYIAKEEGRNQVQHLE